MLQNIFFLLMIAVVAFLYASVGHGGASGYLALMVLFGISPVLMKSSALILNLFVSGIAFAQYYRHGHFNKKILIPFILLSIPCAYIGASIHIETTLYKVVLAVCLFLASLRLLGVFGKSKGTEVLPVKFFPALLIGGFIGFVSGMIGIGGGIILSPILILFHWADMKQTAAVSAAFIFLNSAAGIAGATGNTFLFSPQVIAWIVVAVAAGTAGAFYGSSKFNFVTLRYVLSIVLLFACTKLIIT